MCFFILAPNDIKILIILGSCIKQAYSSKVCPLPFIESIFPPFFNSSVNISISPILIQWCNNVFPSSFNCLKFILFIVFIVSISFREIYLKVLCIVSVLLYSCSVKCNKFFNSFVLSLCFNNFKTFFNCLFYLLFYY